MRVLILGGGAREHALAWRLSESSKCESLFVWPGNAGTEQVAQNAHLNPGGMVESIVDLNPDYVVVGPETFLEQGIVEKLAERGIPAFGPTEPAALLETSKRLALEVMAKASVPHPKSWMFSSTLAVVRFAQSYGKPVAVKADGLAQGKGVQICPIPGEAGDFTEYLLKKYPGKPIVVQEVLEGREVSVFCFTDGWNISPLVAACDYKRLLNLNQGPMTGGMGSYAWPEFWDEELDSWVRDQVMRPVLREMQRRGTPFQGMLYAGLMLTREGPKVLEFNARFGDPETQVILQLLEGDLLEIMRACTEGHLNKVPVSWNRNQHAVGVVMVSGRYPGKYKSGYPIKGLDGDPLVFHASTRSEDGRVMTDSASGRVLTLVGLGSSLEEARKRAYEKVKTIEFEGAQWREDIALLKHPGRP